MRQLIVENKIGGHFNCGRLINSPNKKHKLEYLSDELCVLSSKGDEKIFGVVFNIPSLHIKNKRKEGYNGYHNLIYIYLTKTLKRECGNISKKNIKFLGVSKKRKMVGGQEMFYVLFNIKITKSIEIQLLKTLFNDIKRIKKDIIKILENENPYTYRYIW